MKDTTFEKSLLIMQAQEGSCHFPVNVPCGECPFSMPKGGCFSVEMGKLGIDTGCHEIQRDLIPHMLKVFGGKKYMEHGGLININNGDDK